MITPDLPATAEQQGVSLLERAVESVRAASANAGGVHLVGISAEEQDFSLRSKEGDPPL